MVFSDLVFIFGFMPAVLLSSLIAGRFGNRPLAWVLFSASLGFYAAWRFENLPLLIISLAFNYLAGQQLLVRPSRAGLIACIALNLAPLALFKYAGFALSNVNMLFGTSIAFDRPVLPLAISFFTFQQIMYLVDCYRRQVDQHGPLDYALFVTFFPHLIAGPLVQPKDMLHQWRDADLRPTLDRFGVGLSIFAVGLFKKAVLADGIAPIVDSVFARAASGWLVSAYDGMIGVIGFAWQIYFDFSGYTDMAIGLAWMFGIVLPINFASPYRASSIIEFWQRWHITLSRFLRNYLYYPLGGNRHGPARQMINVMIVMLLGGLWHGAAWTFVIWGGAHGAAIVVNHLWRRFGPAVIRENAWFAPIGAGMTLLIVILAWVPFRATSWAAAMNVYLSLLGHAGTAAEVTTTARETTPLILLGALIIFALPPTQDLFARTTSNGATSGRLRWRPSLAWGLAIGALLAGGLVAAWNIQTTPTFIYFEF